MVTVCKCRVLHLAAGQVSCAYLACMSTASYLLKWDREKQHSSLECKQTKRLTTWSNDDCVWIMPFIHSSSSNCISNTMFKGILQVNSWTWPCFLFRIIKSQTWTSTFSENHLEHRFVEMRSNPSLCVCMYIIGYTSFYLRTCHLFAISSLC